MSVSHPIIKSLASIMLQSKSDTMTPSFFAFLSAFVDTKFNVNALENRGRPKFQEEEIVKSSLDMLFSLLLKWVEGSSGT